MNKPKTLIIAEAGVNHNGSIDIAKKLVVAAKDAGADIVKFQTVNLNKFITDQAAMADYQIDNTGKKQSQREMLEKLQLSFDEFSEIASFCKEIGITFLSTANEEDSIKFLDGIVDYWKIPSGLVTDFPLLRDISMRKKPVILSTGMCVMEEIEDAINVLKSGVIEDITILHCTTNYPAPIEDVNLRAMWALAERFNCPVGYSDHTPGIEVSIAAVALGASVIEKHFTLDRNMVGPDHKASLEPNEFREMVKAIRKVEIALGERIKKPSDEEMKIRNVARKSIVARKNIDKGDIFSEENLIAKRPGSGMSPMKWNDLIGRQAKKPYLSDELIANMELNNYE